MNSESFEDLKVLGHRMAQAEAERIYLLEFRKSKKAMLMTDYELAEPGAPIAKQERYAYSHPDYLQLLEGLKEATQISARLRHEMKVMEMRFETWRTQQATLRAEMQLK